MFKADNFYCGFKGTKKALNDEIVSYRIRGMVLSIREFAYKSLIHHIDFSYTNLTCLAGNFEKVYWLEE